MYKLLIMGTFLLSLTVVPVRAAEITDEAKCRSEIEIVKQMDSESDVGPKFEPIIKDMIGVLEHLCETKAFNEAEDVAAAIRGMLATE